MCGARLKFLRIASIVSCLILAACSGGGGGGSAAGSSGSLPTATTPEISTQPVSQRVLTSQTASFSVVASGTAPLSYQWVRNGAPIPGAMADQYSLVATLTDDGARFSVRVTNSGGTITSNEAVLRVELAAVPPVITAQPVNVSAEVGQKAVFNVQVTGTAPLMYQWQRNGTPIPNATQASYTVDAISIADDGASFSVTVSNAVGIVTSIEAVLAVKPAAVPPTIAMLEGPDETSRGGSATFNVVLNGTPPFQYQWRLNGVEIPSATSQSYTRNGVTLDDHLTAYSVVVSNTAGTVTSVPLVLRIAGAPQLGAGRYFSLAASSTAGLYTWGSNYEKTLARNPGLDFDAAPGLAALPLPSGTTVQQVVGGSRHALALRSDGTVWAWGINYDGTLGIGVDDCCGSPLYYILPVQPLFPAGTVIRKIAAGADFSLALDSTGKVWGWGVNDSGQTGVGVPGGQNQFTNGWLSPVAAALPAQTQFVDIAAGKTFGLALSADGVIWGWGTNLFAPPASSAPVVLNLSLPADVRPVKIAAAEYRALFIDAEGGAWAWGQNDFGELGIGDSISLFYIVTPAKVLLQPPSGIAVVALAGGANHTLYLTSDGAVYAAGLEDFGVLGNGEAGTTVVHSTPVRTLTIGPPNQRAVAIAAGERHSLAILADGSVVGWGANSSGQLGDGTETTRTVPVSSSGLDLE